MPTPAEIHAAALAHVNGRATEALMTPREQAEAAWTPGSTRSVAEIEASIRRRRGMAPVNRTTGAADAAAS